LRACPSLQRKELRLGFREIGLAGTVALVQGCPSLDTLCCEDARLLISTKGLCLDLGNAFPKSRALAQIIWALPNMKHLNLDAEHFTMRHEGLVTLIDSMRRCRQLQSFLMYVYKGEEDAAATALAESFSAWPNLQSFHLETPEFWGHDDDAEEDTGVVALAKGMRFCPTLQELRLRTGSIGDVGVTALAEGLRSCPNLLVLELPHAVIGDVGATALARSLRFCPRLQQLNLFDNEIEEAGATALVEAVRGCRSLQRAILFDYGDDSELEEAQQEVDDILREHKKCFEESCSAARCFLWCRAQLHRSHAVDTGESTTLRSVPHEIAVQIAACIRVPMAQPPVNAVQLVEAAHAAQGAEEPSDILFMSDQIDDGDGDDQSSEPALKRRRF
jgi:Leucine Rich repeat